MGNSPLDIAPGIVKVDSPYSLRGRYVDCDKVRFVKSKPEKWRGWEVFSEQLEGVPRALKCWDDNSDSRWLSCGTHLRLFLVNIDGEKTNITPYASTGTLGSNPFAMTSGSPLVVVTDTAHGVIQGTYVNFDGATAAGGITIDGEYQVTRLIDANSYEITHSSNATSTTTGGGASVTYAYEINPGQENVVQGLGYGTGPYGLGTYGTPRSSSNFTVYARIWSLDTYGENLLGMPSGFNLYQWDPDSPNDRAVKVANSPTGNFFFVTNERYPVVLGADGEPMTIKWPDQNDITIWTPSSTVTANVRRLQKGSRLVAGANLINTSNILWTDSAVYTMNYTGQKNSVYATILAAEKCGLIGPNGFAVAGGRAFWMSSFDFFMFGGSVQHIPNSEEVRDWVFDQLDKKQNWKLATHFASEHNEIRWHFIADGEFEPTLYVAVSLDDFSWTHGTLQRGAWTEKSGINPTTFGADQDGYIYKHEVGEDEDGAAMAWHLESAPVDIQDGDVVMDIHGYIPNFQRQTGDITLTITAFDLPQHTTPLETFTSDIAEGQGIVDMQVGARQAAIKLSGESVGGRFRLGLPALEIEGGGERRGGP